MKHGESARPLGAWRTEAGTERPADALRAAPAASPLSGASVPRVPQLSPPFTCQRALPKAASTATCVLDSSGVISTRSHNLPRNVSPWRAPRGQVSALACGSEEGK